VLAPGKSQILEVTLVNKTYAYKCSIAGHAAAGMKGRWSPPNQWRFAKGDWQCTFANSAPSQPSSA